VRSLGSIVADAVTLTQPVLRREVRGSVGLGKATPSVLSVYVLAGYDSDAAYASRQPTWEPTEEHDELEAAVVAANRWLQERPLGQVEVVELLSADSAAVVRVVTSRGVEVIDAGKASERRSGVRAWMGRPPQVFVIGALFTVAGLWMVAAPESFDDRPSWLVRGLGVVCVLFFGLGTLVAIVRRRRARGRT
jgi:hypothetical protein